eukprot:COSAG01_NODE_22105_length_870_cov_1.919689_1_plen_21_part_01
MEILVVSKIMMACLLIYILEI